MNRWLIAMSSENFEITKERGFETIGIDSPNERKAGQMAPEDRIVFYVREWKKFVATATVTSRRFHENTEIWKHSSSRERFRSRVRVSLDADPGEEHHVDGMQIGPTLEYVKRWPPEMWNLALAGMVHILSKRDFDVLECELERFIETDDPSDDVDATPESTLEAQPAA